MTNDLQNKWTRLLLILTGMRRIAVALSGGVDSTLVAFAAYRALRDDAVAITADSPSVPRAELAEAARLAAWIGIRHEIVATNEFENPDYARNDGARCYFCKSELYRVIEAKLPDWQLEIICSGANLDDSGDYRPGLQAAAERHIRHPLQEAQLTKSEVRSLAREFGLPNADKPALPCLSSRIAPGLGATPERTLRIELAEDLLHRLGFAECRVRLHPGELARIEVPIDRIDRLLELREQVAAQLREFGFEFVTIDLDGLRSGSLNALVPLEIRRRYQQTKGTT